MPKTEIAFGERDENPTKPIRRFPRQQIRRHPRLKWEREAGQPVFSPAFGFGKIVTTIDTKIVVKFGKNERVVGAQDLMTRAQAENDWHMYWLTGERRRFEEGKRLSIVKDLCRFGEWQAFLGKYDYPRSTADDLIKRYKDELKWEARNQLPGNRASQIGDPGQQVKEHAEDPEGRERRELVKTETEKRHEKEPTYHKTLWSIRIKLPPDILDLCRNRYKRKGKSAKKFWRLAAYIFVGVELPHLTHHRKSH